jgi:hypothetical protein
MFFYLKLCQNLNQKMVWTCTSLYNSIQNKEQAISPTPMGKYFLTDHTLILLQKKLRYKYLKNEQIFLICKY